MNLKESISHAITRAKEAQITAAEARKRKKQISQLSGPEQHAVRLYETALKPIEKRSREEQRGVGSLGMQFAIHNIAWTGPQTELYKHFLAQLKADADQVYSTYGIAPPELPEPPQARKKRK